MLWFKISLHIWKHNMKCYFKHRYWKMFHYCHGNDAVNPLRKWPHLNWKLKWLHLENNLFVKYNSVYWINARVNDKRKLKLRLSSQLRLINLALRACTLNRSQYLPTTFWQFGNHPESCIKRPATPVGMFKPLKIQKPGINFHFSLPKDENKFLTLIPLFRCNREPL